MWSVLAENLTLLAAAVLIGAATGWWELKPRAGREADSGENRT